MAGIGQEVGAHTLHAAHIGLVTHHQKAQALGTGGDRQGAGKGAPELVARPARGVEHGRTLDIAEQGFVDAFQHFRIADRADQQAAILRNMEGGPRGGIGKDDPAAGDVVGLVARHDDHRVGNGAQHFLETRPLGLHLDGDFGGLGGRGSLGGGQLARGLIDRIGGDQQGNKDGIGAQDRCHRGDDQDGKADPRPGGNKFQQLPAPGHAPPYFQIIVAPHSIDRGQTRQ